MEAQNEWDALPLCNWVVNTTFKMVIRLIHSFWFQNKMERGWKHLRDFDLGDHRSSGDKDHTRVPQVDRQCRTPSDDIDNYHDTRHIIISVKFKEWVFTSWVKVVALNSSLLSENDKNLNILQIRGRWICHVAIDENDFMIYLIYLRAAVHKPLTTKMNAHLKV